MATVKRRTALRLLASAVAAAALPAAGCGTLLHPERVGQPRTGRLDTAVCVLDGVGCLLFVVPGVVALLVDYATGALFLPPGIAAAGDGGGELDPATGLVRYDLIGDGRHLAALEAEVSAKLGRPVLLGGPEVTVERFDSPADVPADRLRAQSPDR